MKIIIYGFVLVLFLLSGCSEDTPKESKDVAPLVQDDVLVVTPGSTTEIDAPVNDTDMDEQENDTNDSTSVSPEDTTVVIPEKN